MRLARNMSIFIEDSKLLSRTLTLWGYGIVILCNLGIWTGMNEVLGLHISLPVRLGEQRLSFTDCVACVGQLAWHVMHTWWDQSFKGLIPSTRTACPLHQPLPLPSRSLTLKVWVQFSHYKGLKLTQEPEGEQSEWSGLVWYSEIGEECGELEGNLRLLFKEQLLLPSVKTLGTQISSSFDLRKSPSEFSCKKSSIFKYRPI